ncbi:hypothetical protein [Aurantimonas sp. HBX-1]|uniref:hypothetical protein n=1 Tax=Aurantimonas sp. HBX-1 TaxID=2906072 RepID=UPI001F2E6072|nr:hypothetical protein [Aurantimonas sp. HBX-1]UIJ71555.1 hypothetical protein LXB15_17910 [Aurantimonas sp. HBX-1]
MVLINFPGRLDYVRERVVLASILPSSWPLVLRCIEEFFPLASVGVERIAVQPIPPVVSTPPRQRMAVGMSSPPEAAVFRVDSGMVAAGAIIRLGPTGAPQPGSAQDGAGLVLEVERGEAVLLAVRFPTRLGPRYDAAIATLLKRLRDDLILSYRATRILTQGGRLDRPTLEAGWDRLLAGVALLSSRLRIQAANVATDDLLADRRFFLPPVAGVVQPAVKADAERMLDAAGRILQGGSAGESLVFAALRGPQRLLMRLYRLDRSPPFGDAPDAAPRVAARLLAVIEAEQPGVAEQASPLASTIACLTPEMPRPEALQTGLCRA